MNITAAVVPVRSAPFEIETLDLAAPLADEVLVRVVASGMCHTDLHARDGYFPNLPYPVVCGHEGAGIIEQVGADVADLAPGDPVVISFPWCSECGPCRAERISYCERARPLKSSGRRADGSIPMSRYGEPVYSCFFQQSSFASFAVAPAKDVVKIRRDAPIEMLGPLGCGLQIVFRRPGGTRGRFARYRRSGWQSRRGKIRGAGRDISPGKGGVAFCISASQASEAPGGEKLRLRCQTFSPPIHRSRRSEHPCGSVHFSHRGSADRSPSARHIHFRERPCTGRPQRRAASNLARKVGFETPSTRAMSASGMP